jgi:hypothetical protein
VKKGAGIKSFILPNGASDRLTKRNGDQSKILLILGGKIPIMDKVAWAWPGGHTMERPSECASIPPNRTVVFY